MQSAGAAPGACETGRDDDCDRPYSVALASAMASSPFRNVGIGATGPKISSLKATIPGVTPVMTAGSKKSPLREPPVSTFARPGVKTGRAEAAPRNTIHVVMSSKLRSKVVIDMRRAPTSGQKDDSSTGASPIENLQPDVLVDGNKPRLVRRSIVPRGSGRGIGFHERTNDY